MNEDIDFSLDQSVYGRELVLGSGRLYRLEWLTKRIPEQDLYLLQDGVFSQLLFNEISECFINGQFIATIVLGFSFIERAIAGRLSFIGDKKIAAGTSEQLINAAHKKGWLTETECNHLNDLRKLRNPVVHFKEPLDLSRPEVASILRTKTTPQLLEGNAQQILEATIHVLNKTAL